jgi:rhomboid protease GluP
VEDEGREPAIRAAQQATEDRRFFIALFSRATPVTYFILFLNFVIFIVMSAVSSGDLLTNIVWGVDESTLIAFGAKLNTLIRDGEWFRFVTPIFIHIGLLHIASNSYALWIIGPLVERLYGSARYLMIYLLCGISGVAGSFIWNEMRNNPDGPSAGASGAIFGLFGLLAVFGFKYRNELPPNFGKAIWSSIVPVILINLFIGFSFPFIDNAAHIGGLIAGGMLALIIPYIPYIPYISPASRGVSIFDLTGIMLSLALIIVSFAQAFQESGIYFIFRGRMH